MAPKTDTVAVRVDAETLARLDKVAEEMSRRGLGAEITRSVAARVALIRGLEALEQEIGTAGKAPKARKG